MVMAIPDSAKTAAMNNLRIFASPMWAATWRGAAMR